MKIAEIDPLTLPSLLLSERSRLPNYPAIYFVLSSNCVLYIGRTVNLANRLSSHNRLQQFKALDESLKVAWLKCDEIDLLDEIEAALISYFEPPLNGSALPTNKPRLVLYMNPDKLAELQEWAKDERRSPSNLAIYLIEKTLEKRQKKPKEESE